MNKSFKNIAAVIFILFSITHGQTPVDLNRNNKIDIYENPQFSVSERVSDLLRQMTLEEKIGQMCQHLGRRNKASGADIKNIDEDPSEAFSEKNIIALVMEGKVGSFLTVEYQKDCNLFQKASLNSRLGIPLLIGIDAIHGNAYTKEGGTVYPTEIGIASTFEPEIAERIAKYTAKEMRAVGYNWAFSPNIEVVYDARWGRCGETFGEDPYLVGKMGAAMIQGYQSGGSSSFENVAACAKHFAGGGIPVNGLNAAPADISERTLMEEIFPPFKEAVDAGVFTIMAAHNEINGIPSHMHKGYLTDMIRGKWGFQGFYVSDWMDMERLFTNQKVAESIDDAYRLSVNAGLDMHMHGPGFYESMIAHVKAGRVSEERITDAVRKILTAKIKLGLFENRISTKEMTAKTILHPDHQKLSLEAARKSIVLLKNEKNILPLKKGLKRILVTGTLADNQAIVGDWVLPTPDSMVTTVLEGIRASAGSKTAVDFVDAGPIFSMNDQKINEAQKLSENADAIIVVAGENGQRRQAPGLQTIGENIDRPVLDLRGNKKS